MKRVIGWFILFLIFAVIFISIGEEMGYKNAVFVFAVSFVGTGLVVYASFLISSEK